MYITEVSGHHSAANAVEKALKMLEPSTQILSINAFNYTNPISEKIVNRLYMSVIKQTPKIWDYLYDNPSVIRSLESLKKSIHKFNYTKLRKLFDRFKPDIVACSQAFPCGMVADYKKSFGSDMTLIAVLTDYVPHSFWLYDTVNYYISPSEEAGRRLINKGIAPNRIKSLGIPFDPKFIQPISKDESLRKLGLKPQVPTLLIMGGGQGLGPIKAIVESLEKMPGELQEIIVTGTNKKLYSSLRRKLKKLKKKVLLFGYANNIGELMSVSDIIITKPGGITTAEALAKGLPMIIVNPIPGQEENNARYLTEMEAAIQTDEPREMNRLIEELLYDQMRLNNMREAACRIAKPSASMDIAKLILSL
jgi:processive 1,2-diacylglycerol beta-glucosyltransferase